MKSQETEDSFGVCDTFLVSQIPEIPVFKVVYDYDYSLVSFNFRFRIFELNGAMRNRVKTT